jgi:protocatechuate 3,4-dioxygenase beta subunit
MDIMNQLKFSIFVYSLFFASISFAKEKPILNRLNYCPLTKSAINNYEPSSFESTNNLLRRVGQEELYCGEKIIVRGRLLDQNCIPVPDATIYAWQANCSGKYPYQPLKTMVDKNLVHINNDVTFTGNGTATTNSKGEFHFITVYPQAIHNQASHINIRVKHHNLGSLQTRLILTGKKIDDPQSDPELGTIADIAVENDISIYNFDVVMKGVGMKEY